MNVSLTPELESLIHHKVSNGRYPGALSQRLKLCCRVAR